MSGDLEAAGAFATAGLAAGVIEGREAHGAGEGGCANCGAAITGPYCSQCGQATHPHRSLAHVFEEFLHGILHFDTKAWRTLPMLAFRPGTLTRNYVYGKRARYISPLALFLFTVFLMFAVFSFSGQQPVQVNQTVSVEDAQERLTGAQEELAAAQQTLAELEASETPAPEPAMALARAAVEEAQAAVARRENLVERAAANGAGQTVINPEEDGEESWQDQLRHAAEQEDFVIVTGWDWLNEKIRHKFENPDLAVYKMQQAAYKFSFLLIPISLPFLALLFFWKRGVTLYDHVVFLLYGLSFASLVFITLVLGAQTELTAWLAPVLITLAMPIHMFFHLKGAYALGWFSALWRSFFMLVFANVALVIFLLVIIVLGLTG